MPISNNWKRILHVCCQWAWFPASSYTVCVAVSYSMCRIVYCLKRGRTNSAGFGHDWCLGLHVWTTSINGIFVRIIRVSSARSNKVVTTSGSGFPHEIYGKGILHFISIMQYPCFSQVYHEEGTSLSKNISRIESCTTTPVRIRLVVVLALKSCETPTSCPCCRIILVFFYVLEGNLNRSTVGTHFQLKSKLKTRISSSTKPRSLIWIISYPSPWSSLFCISCLEIHLRRRWWPTWWWKNLDRLHLFFRKYRSHSAFVSFTCALVSRVAENKPNRIADG